MKIVTCFNIKGGVGKTTLINLLSLKLSEMGYKVLLIDGDTQANLTQFMYKVVHNDKTMFEALTDGISADEIIIKSPMESYPNIDLIPSDLSLSVLGEYLTTKTNRERAVFRWFKHNIDTLEKYDYIVIDLSPSYDLVTRNFLMISDSIITPLEYQDIASIRGCELFYQQFNKDLADMEMENEAKRAVVINSYTTRKLSSGDMFNEYLASFPNIQKDLLESKLSETTVVKNAVMNKLSIDDYCRKIKKAPKIKVDFNEFIKELMTKEIL